MSENQSVQIGSDEQQTHPGFARWESEPASPQSQPTEPRPAGPVVRDPAERSGAIIFRNGEVSVVPLQHASSTDVAEKSTDPLDNGRDGTWHNPVPRHMLKGDSIIKLDGIEGDLAGFERLGLVEKGPDGQYRITEQKQQEQPKQDAPPAMDKISDKAENFMAAAASTLGPSAMHSVALTLIEGKELKSAGDLASQLQMEPATFGRAVERITAEFTQQARTALGMDEQTFADFTSWAWSNDENANAVREAILSQVDKGSLAPLKTLGARFIQSGSAFSDDDLLSADLGEGVRVYRDSGSGKLLLSARGQTMLAREAIKHAVVKISRAR